MTARRLSRVATLFALTLLVPAFGPATALAEVAVSQGANITLTTRGEPLVEVLTYLGEQVPLQLRQRGQAVTDPVTLEIEAADWPDLFAKLLGHASYALQFDTASGQPSQLTVLWDKVRAARESGAQGMAAGDDTEARIRALAAQQPAPPDPADLAVAQLEEARAAYLAAEAALDDAKATGAGNLAALTSDYQEARQAYAEAIAMVGNYDKGGSVTALLPSLAGDDRDLRLSGLESLRWLSETGRNSEALELAHGALVTAEDDDVARAALEVLVRYGDETEILPLLEPLALNEGPNQAFAQREYLRIRDEMKARESGSPQQ